MSSSGCTLALAICVCAAASCGGGKTERSAALTLVGDPVRGERIARSSGCPACHEIPGVREPGGKVGPALRGFAGRTYIAGSLPNTPANLTRWLMNPPQLQPQTAMPDLDLTEAQAQDVTAFLDTLD